LERVGVSDLSHFLREAEKQDIIITRHGWKRSSRHLSPPVDPSAPFMA
jgi:hypothetical protein